MANPFVGSGVALASAYIASSFEWLKANEMAEVMFLEQHFCTTGPGPKLLPKWLFRAERFPTLKLPLNLRIPITGADASQAEFYADDGRVLRLDSFSGQQKQSLLADPLSKRSVVMVEASVLYKFVRTELYQFITEIGSYEALGEILGLALKNSLEGTLSRVTVSTMLERKEKLSEIFDDKLRARVSNPSKRAWGISIEDSFIGPIELDKSLSDALAERLRIAHLGLGRAEAIGTLSKYLKTSEGQMAANLEITRQVYEGAQKVILSPGAANPIVLSGI